MIDEASGEAPPSRGTKRRRVREQQSADRQVPKILLTYEEAAWSLGICERNLRTMVSRGQVPVVELGGKVLFDPGDLEELRQKHKTLRSQGG